MSGSGRPDAAAVDAAGLSLGISATTWHAEITEALLARAVAAVADGVHAAGKKVVEEAAESWMAAEHETLERTAEEISQLLYRVQVLMLARGLTLDDVYTHL